MANMTNRAWSTQRPPCRDLSHTELSCDGSLARRLARHFDDRAEASPSNTDERITYRACADLMRATGTAKKMAAITGHWWAIRMEIVPSWLGRKLADTLHFAALEQSRGWVSGPHQSQEDDQNNEELRGLFHSTWQTHTIPPPGPSLQTDGDIHYIDFTPWMGRIDWRHCTPPTLASLVIQVDGAGTHDSSIQVLGAFFPPHSPNAHGGPAYHGQSLLPALGAQHASGAWPSRRAGTVRRHAWARTMAT